MRVKKALILLFFSLLIIKLLLIQLIPVPLGYSDSLAYFEQAKTFFETGSLTQLIETAKFPPLYAIVISPAYLFQDMDTVFLVMKIINSILSSLIIFPAYFLAKEFLSPKKSILFATLTAFIPTIFTMNLYIFSENLFFLVFLTTIFCIYKAYTEYKTKWAVLTGIGIGLCILTRFSALLLLVALIIITGIKVLKKEWRGVKTFIISSCTLGLSLTPWLLAKVKLSSWSLRSLLLGYTPEVQNITQESFLWVKIIWTILYTNYLFLAIGILTAILAIQCMCNYKKANKQTKTILEITGILSIITIFIAANNAGSIIPYTAHRVIGRYIAALFPLWLLLSLTQTQIKKSYILITGVFLLFTTPFIIFGVFYPINNSELIWIEIAKTIISDKIMSAIIITSIVSLFTLFLLFIRKIKTTTYFTFIAIYFITISLLSTAAVIYDAQERWYPLEEVQMGMWITENLSPSATFYFDPQDLEHFKEGTPIDRTNAEDRPITVIAYWIRGEIINKKIILNLNEEQNPNNADYIITTKTLNKELVKEGATIKIYKND